MKEELSPMKQNGVYEMVDPPPGRKIVGNRWVFRTKIGEDGSVVKHKARLAAKRYTQREGMDYDETFAPVARFEIIRIFLSTVAQKPLHLKQFDVKTAFLHGKLSEEIYTRQP